MLTRRVPFPQDPQLPCLCPADAWAHNSLGPKLVNTGLASPAGKATCSCFFFWTTASPDADLGVLRLQFLIKDTIAREGVSPTTAGPSFPLKRFLSPATAPLVFVPTTGPRRTADDNAVRDRVTDALRNALHELVQVGEQAAEGRDFEWSDEPTGGGSGGGGVAQPDRTFRVTASRNVWSRKARRVAALADAAAPKPELSQEQVEQAPASGVTKDPPPPQQSPMLDLRIEIWTTTARETESSEARDGPASSASSSIRLEGWWIRGLDQERSALEGLWGFLTRRIGDAVREQEVGAEGVEGKGEAGGGGGEMEGGGGGAVGSRRKRRKL